MTQTVGFIDQFGKNDDVPTTGEDVRGTGVDKVYLTSAETMSIVSGDALDDAGTAAGGAHKIVIVGLDSNWDLQEEEVTMDGQTPVVTTTTWFRVNRAYVTDIGTHASGTNVGAITITQGTSGNVECTIIAGEGQSQEAEWTVPRNRVLKIQYFWTNIGKSDDATVHFVTREFGKAWRIRTELKLYQNELRHEFGHTITVPAKSDVKVRALARAGTIVVSAGFFGEILDVSGSPPPVAPQP
jgi:hypothetical protein